MKLIVCSATRGSADPHLARPLDHVSDRDGAEHLARYVSRPPIATERLALTEGAHIRCALKTPYRDGTTHVAFEPLDFIARLVALIPELRALLTRYL